MAAEPRVTITTLSWNRKMHTLEWLRSLDAIEYRNFDVLVVDNGSSDGSVEAIRSKFPRVNVIENARNLGYARGFNIAMERAFADGADYVLVMNNDSIIDPASLTALVDVACTSPDVGFVSGKVFHYWRPDEIQTVGMLYHPWRVAGAQIGFGEVDRGQYDAVTERDLTDDVFLLVSREVFEAIGGYDEDFAYYGHENVDWCMRTRAAGFKIMYAPAAKLWHKGRTGGGWSPFYLFHQTRNDYVLLAKHLPRTRAMVAGAMLAFFYQPSWFAFRVRPTKPTQVRAFLRGQLAGIRWLLKHAGEGPRVLPPRPALRSRSREAIGSSTRGSNHD